MNKLLDFVINVTSVLIIVDGVFLIIMGIKTKDIFVIFGGIITIAFPVLIRWIVRKMQNEEDLKEVGK